ncbi:hypothetical protein HB912_11795 [Listeria aquatica]|uniref:Response regulatory domain-containing protein n=1 Tax=Listeria aquatica TaxID=1494960 RepID=A0A841ZNU2_9LIST|nr:hypothetical protein [Listeria aquatica]MBC1522329.1 hypothetical protein [Listeria aquatica]
MKKLYILEDNFLHREYILKSIHAIDEVNTFEYEIEIVTEFNSFAQEISNRSISDLDIFLIDIDLNSYFSGLDLAERIRQINEECILIFITADNTKGLEVINKHLKPFAYIIKDVQFSQLNLEKVFHKAFEWIYSPKLEQRVVLNSSFNKLIYPAREINFFRALPKNRYHVLMQTSNSEKIIGMSIGKVKKLVPKDIFLTNLKSYVFNVKNIIEADVGEGKLIFKGDSKLSLTPHIVRKVVNDPLFIKWMS